MKTGSRSVMRYPASRTISGTVMSVNTASCTSPFTMRSTTFGRPSCTLRTCSTGIPEACSSFAVPFVDMILKPSATS